MLFAFAERKKLPNGGKGQKITECMSGIGKAWSTAPDGEKDKWRDLSAYLMEKYCNGVRDENGYMFSSVKKKKRGMKMLKGINTQLGIKPKKIMSPYICFVKKERPKMAQQCPNLTFGETMKYLSERWKEMDNEQKQTFVEASERDKRRYEMEVAQNEATQADTSQFMYKKVKGKKKNKDGSTQITSQTQKEIKNAGENDETQVD